MVMDRNLARLLYISAKHGSTELSSVCEVCNEISELENSISRKLNSHGVLLKQLKRAKKQHRFYRDKYYGTIPDNYIHIKREHWNTVLFKAKMHDELINGRYGILELNDTIFKQGQQINLLKEELASMTSKRDFQIERTTNLINRNSILPKHIDELTINQDAGRLEYMINHDIIVTGDGIAYSLDKLKVYEIMLRVIHNWNTNNPTLQLGK